MKKILSGPCLLLIAAMIWGTSFVSQDLASESVGAFTFGGLRMLLGSLVLLPVILVRNRGHFFAKGASRSDRKRILLSGLVCGTVLFCACSAQQIGIEMGTSAGKSAFITAMYVVLVPIIGLFFRKRVRPAVWLSVLGAAVGLYFLCLVNFDAGISGVFRDLTFSSGDVVTLVCAVFFAFHILSVDRFAATVDGLTLSCLQFFVAGVMGTVLMFLLEAPTWEGIFQARYSILYSGVLSCGVAYTLQILGQKKTAPAVASLLMCLESVFAVLSDQWILGTQMSLEEGLGCVLMFAALTVTSISEFFPERKNKKRRNP